MPPVRKTFDKMFLEEDLICFKENGDGKKYICFVRYDFCNMYRKYM